MFTDQLKQLTAMRAKVTGLEQAIATERKAELAALPARYGFDGAAAFIAAVRAAGGKRRGRKPGRGKPTKASATKGRRRRARITEETRAAVKKMSAAGKTGAAIAQALKISLPSVQNIRKALGLVKARKK